MVELLWVPAAAIDGLCERGVEKHVGLDVSSRVEPAEPQEFKIREVVLEFALERPEPVVAEVFHEVIDPFGCQQLVTFSLSVKVAQKRFNRLHDQAAWSILFAPDCVTLALQIQHLMHHLAPLVQCVKRAVGSYVAAHFIAHVHKYADPSAKKCGPDRYRTAYPP